MNGREPTRTDLDRVSGTRLGTLWALPFFGATAIGVAFTPGTTQAPPPSVPWVIAGLVSLAGFSWAVHERSRARAILRELHRTQRESGVPAAAFIQYEICISLLVFVVRMRTAPREQARATGPILITALLGWWSLLGPFYTVRALLANARGGHRRTAHEILGQLHASRPAEAAWWRRTLALDSGNVTEIAANLAIAAVLAFLLVMVAVAALR